MTDRVSGPEFRPPSEEIGEIRPKTGEMGGREVKVKEKGALDPITVAQTIGENAGKRTEKGGFTLRPWTKVIAKRDSRARRFLGAVKKFFGGKYSSVKLKISDARGEFSTRINNQNLKFIEQGMYLEKGEIDDMIDQVEDADNRPEDRAYEFGKLCTKLANHPNVIENPMKLLRELKPKMDALENKDVSEDLYKAEFAEAERMLTLLPKAEERYGAVFDQVDEMVGNLTNEGVSRLLESFETYVRDLDELVDSGQMRKEVALRKILNLRLGFRDQAKTTGLLQLGLSNEEKGRIDKARDVLLSKWEGYVRPAEVPPEAPQEMKVESHEAPPEAPQEVKVESREAPPPRDTLDELLGQLESDVRAHAKPKIFGEIDVEGAVLEDLEKALMSELPTRKFDNIAHKILVSQNYLDDPNGMLLQALLEVIRTPDLSPEDREQIDKKFYETLLKLR